MVGTDHLSLYFHFPFCSRKCPYCSFYVLPNQEEAKTLFLQALKEEWREKLPLTKGKKVVSLYFGGGTPTLFPEGVVAMIQEIRKVHSVEGVEITVEGNPEEITSPLVDSLKNENVNRLSLGIQSLDDESLEILGRKHNGKQGIDAIETAWKGGIENISIDLMIELPHQTTKRLEKTLQKLPSLPISHLSLYNLTIEPHTAFHKRRKEILKAQPKEEEAVNMLQKSCEAIEKAGLNHYEISAFAKKGKESIHNTGYWSFRPFLGLGPSAYSFYEGRRFRNIAHLKKWAQALEERSSPIDFEEKLSYPANVLERLAIGLRLFTGVDLSMFPSLPPSFPEMEKKLQKEGFLKKEGSHLFLSSKGRLFYDSVAEELISLYL